ncbi:MAG: tetratricopeptide repeat protein [Bryobacteraceae bacterium]
MVRSLLQALPLVWPVCLFAGEAAEKAAWRLALDEAESARAAGRVGEADERFGRAMAEAERVDPEGVAVAIVLNNSGYHLQEQGHILEATRRYTRALAIFERAGSEEHHLIEVAMNLSGAYLETGQVSRAESLLRQVLSGASGLTAGDRAGVMGDLASVAVQQGNLVEGERIFREVLRILQEESGNAAKERIVSALSNLSMICAGTGRTREADRFVRRAREALAALRSPPPILAIKTLANSAAISAGLGRRADADRYYKEAIAHCERAFGINHFLLGSVLTTYSQFLRLAKRKKEAREAEARARAISEEFARDNLIGYTVDLKAAQARGREKSRRLPRGFAEPGRH